MLEGTHALLLNPQCNGNQACRKEATELLDTMPEIVLGYPSTFGCGPSHTCKVAQKSRFGGDTFCTQAEVPALHCLTNGNEVLPQAPAVPAQFLLVPQDTAERVLLRDSWLGDRLAFCCILKGTHRNSKSVCQVSGCQLGSSESYFGSCMALPTPRFATKRNIFVFSHCLENLIVPRNNPKTQQQCINASFGLKLQRRYGGGCGGSGVLNTYTLQYDCKQ